LNKKRKREKVKKSKYMVSYSTGVCVVDAVVVTRHITVLRRLLLQIRQVR